MKGMNVIFSNQIKDDWKTPPSFVKFINKNFKIAVDPCCSVFNVRAKKHYTIKDNGLKQKWETWTFVNPPYSDVKIWIKKAYKEYQKGNKVLMLIFAKSENSFFQQYAFKANYILFIRGRLKFQYGNKRKRNAAPFGSCLIVFGKINRYQHKALKTLGVLINLKNVKK